MPAIPAIPNIDHPIIAVRDMAAGRAAYERLGFTVTPRGRHRTWGTGNWCIMFERDYLELRGVIAPGDAHNLGRFLEEREGLMGVAFGCVDAEASHALLSARGLAPQPVMRLSREFELPEGIVEPRFTLCFIDAAHAPGLMSVVLCQHLTPELLRRPAWLHHANGVRGVHGMTAVVPDLSAAAEAFATLVGRDAVQRSGDRVEIRVGTEQWIVVMAEAAAREYWPGLSLPALGAGFLLSVTLDVENAAATRSFLRSRGIACQRAGSGAVRVPPDETCGVPLEFSEPTR